jgi:hypothetical protein
MGKTAAEMAIYVIAENRAVGPLAYDIEARYLAHVYAGDAVAGIVPVSELTDIEEIDAQVDIYREFCGL